MKNLGRPIAFGHLVLKNVPVMEESPSVMALSGPRYLGTLGLTALKELKLIVDGEHGKAFLICETLPPLPYAHNRAGVAFLPNSTEDNSLIAKVADNSPAQQAGIRTGDQLLKINEDNVTMSQPAALNRLSQPAGTKINFTLERNGTNFNTTVILRDILQPAKESVP